MEDFLNYLAERKYNLYHYLHIAKPQAYTNDECFDRIERKSQYLQILDVINYLPVEQQIIVRERFDELKG
jgi:hypothetical protein